MRRRVLSVPFLACAVALGCGGSSGGSGTGNPFQEVIDLGGDRYVGTIEPESRRVDGDWVRYEFAEDSGALCLNGSRYRTDVRHSDSEDLLVFLWGIGACVPGGVCLTNQAPLPAGPAFDLFAFMDVEVEGRPLREWDLAMVSYCDGSLTVGDVDLDLDGDGTVDRYHRGLANTSAGLDVAFGEFPEPRRIVLAGISGGAYSTIPGVMLVRNQWRDVSIDVINDAGVGLGRDGDPTWIDGVLESWNITSLIPPSCRDCTGNGHITRLLDWQLRRDPNLRIAALTSYEDFIIGDLFIGIDGSRFRAGVTGSLAEVSSAHPGRYERFVYEGDGHTLIALGLDTKTAGGVLARDWLEDMLNHRPWTSAVDR